MTHLLLYLFVISIVVQLYVGTALFKDHIVKFYALIIFTLSLRAKHSRFTYCTY